MEQFSAVLRFFIYQKAENQTNSMNSSFHFYFFKLKISINQPTSFFLCKVNK